MAGRDGVRQRCCRGTSDRGRSSRFILRQKTNSSFGVDESQRSRSEIQSGVRWTPTSVNGLDGGWREASRDESWTKKGDFLINEMNFILAHHR